MFYKIGPRLMPVEVEHFSCGARKMWQGQTWVRIHNTSFTSSIMNGPNKLEHYITIGWKGFARNKHFSLFGHFIK
jgi:hypothetical protein